MPAEITLIGGASILINYGFRGSTYDVDALYEAYAQEESAAKDALLTFDDKYPDVLKEDNLSDVLSHLMANQKEVTEWK